MYFIYFCFDFIQLSHNIDIVLYTVDGYIYIYVRYIVLLVNLLLTNVCFFNFCWGRFTASRTYCAATTSYNSRPGIVTNGWHGWAHYPHFRWGIWSPRWWWKGGTGDEWRGTEANLERITTINSGNDHQSLTNFISMDFLDSWRCWTCLGFLYLQSHPYAWICSSWWPWNSYASAHLSSGHVPKFCGPREAIPGWVFGVWMEFGWINSTKFLEISGCGCCGEGFGKKAQTCVGICKESAFIYHYEDPFMNQQS